MSAQHTPGPWDVEHHGRGDVQVVQEDFPPGVTICKMSNWLPEFLEERDANARLIAAAPDLLAALRGLDEAYCRAGAPLSKADRHEDRLRLIAARAAIAKATGSAS